MSDVWNSDDRWTLARDVFVLLTTLAVFYALFGSMPVLFAALAVLFGLAAFQSQARALAFRRCPVLA